MTKKRTIITTIVFIGLIASFVSVAAQGMMGDDSTGPGMMGPGMMGPGMMGPGMMGPGMMGPGMMESVESEYDFLTLMIPHHQDAIDSARQLLQNTERAQLRELADTIIETQSAEIETMQGWLEQWYPSRDHDVPYEPMMSDLSGLTTDESERVFLEDMIVHHMMAVHMSQQLLMRGLVEHAPVEGFAQDIAANQMAEMQQMHLWLQDWYGVTMPMGRMMDGTDRMDGADEMNQSTP